VSGDVSDYIYAHLGVASGGLEIGDDFYQDCDGFENEVYPDNLNTLLYAIKLAKKPNALSKGPDIFDLTVSVSEGVITGSAEASDSELVNIDGYDSFTTGDQIVTKVEMYVDVLPDEYGDGDLMYLLQPGSVPGSDRVFVETEISTTGLSSGRHVLYARATDGDGYVGPTSSVFFYVENAVTSSPTASPTIFTPETTTTTFTTRTSTIETVSPTNEPSVAIMTDAKVKTTTKPSNVPSNVAMTIPTLPPADIEMTTEPSNKPSIANNRFDEAPISPSSVAPFAPPSGISFETTYTPVLSSEDTPTAVPVSTTSVSPSASDAQTVGISDTIPIPTSTTGIESGVPTLSHAPSGTTDSSTDASTAETENAAFSHVVNSGLFATALLLLLSYLW
jgi:hypothetical protein